MRYRRGIAISALAGAAMIVLPVVTPAPAMAASKPEVIASGLDNPEKLSFGPDGKLYVAEAGPGGTANADHSNCVPAGDQGQEACFGATGAVTKINLSDNSKSRVVQGLPSLGGPGSEGSSGPTDVAVAADGTIYVVNSLGTDPNARDQAGSPITELGTVWRQGPTASTPSQFADIAAFERDNDPDKNEPRVPGDTEPTTDSNPYAMTMKSDGTLLVADAGANDVLGVDSTGTVSLVSALPFRMVDPPPFVVCQPGQDPQTDQCIPPGQQMPMQPVPTSVEVVPSQLPAPVGTDTVYIGQLTGFPFPVGGANVYKLNSNSDKHANLDVFEPNLTNVIDVAVAPDGTMYALEFASNGLLDPNPQPALIQIRPDGTRKALLNGSDGDLVAPGGVAVGPDGMVYVTNCALCGAGAGTVIKVDPTKARDDATASACDPVKVPGSDFDDITQDFHREAIECLAWWGLVQGKTATSFDPTALVSRGQMASELATLMEAAGFTLPNNPPDAFPDDNGSPHEHAINQLAALGVLRGYTNGNFGPNDNVSRAQVASLVVNAVTKVEGGPFVGAPDAFSDDTGDVHENDINVAAARGWVNGVGGGKYNPSGLMPRDQAASVIARALSTLVDDGKATPPSS
ncbi:MAG TPA: ScyD/ScyE family protein [Acidimicrobiales bacterium]|nr:ScyD/ScyE family protein [Acidimicrobiales bacterium]